MIYHSLKKNTEKMRFDLRCKVSKYNFELIKKESEDFDFKWDDFETQFWDTSDDWGDLFDIYKTDEKNIDPNDNDIRYDMIYDIERLFNKGKIHLKEIKFEGTIDFDLDKIEPLVKELETFREYFTSSWEGNIYYLGEKRKDLIGKNYNIYSHGNGWDKPMTEKEQEDLWKKVKKTEEEYYDSLTRKKRYDSEGEEIPDDWDSDFLPEDRDERT